VVASLTTSCQEDTDVEPENETRSRTELVVNIQNNTGERTPPTPLAG
jgi:hypothetical protein